MRDLLLMSLVVLGSVIALYRPWVGVMVWTWISIMNPHRYTFGFAYDAPIAAMAAASTLVGLLFARDKSTPFKGPGPVLLAFFMVWMTLSWLLGLDIDGDYPQWDKVMKIDLMILVAMALLHTKKHIFALAWVCTVSLGLLGAKGGAFTIMNGGNYKVWGPDGSFIADNNHFALAVVMTIPLVRFLQMQLSGAWAKRGMTVVMILLAASALGSHSRGGLLAVSAMGLVLWWRGRNKLVGGIVIALVAVSLVTFMPEEWSARMNSIENYEEDTSALGRFSAWWVAWGIGWHYPFGVGFNASRSELFGMYSPNPQFGTPAAHSIYFQVLGHHGFIGLAIFLAIWVVTWATAGRIRKVSAGIPEARWADDLAAMCQVSLVGYAVGGAFLSLAYFDLPYNLMALVTLTYVWVRKRAWETEPVTKPGWFRIPGLSTSPQR